MTLKRIKKQKNDGHESKLTRLVAFSGMIILGLVAGILTGEMKLSKSIMAVMQNRSLTDEKNNESNTYNDSSLLTNQNNEEMEKSIVRLQAELRATRKEMKHLQEQMEALKISQQEQQQQQQVTVSSTPTITTNNNNNKSVNFSTKLQTDPNAKYLADCELIQQEDPTLYPNFVTKVNATSTTASSRILLSSSYDMVVHPLRTDRVVSTFVVRYGCFDCHLWTRTLQALEDNQDSFLLDIGSNIGLFGLSAAALNKTVYAFEPFKKNWRRICQSLERNPRLQQHLTLYQSALSDTGPNIISYRQPWKNNPSALRIVDTHQQKVPVSNNKGDDNNSDKEEGVDYGWAVTLDSLQNSLPMNRPVVIKMDVEGYECNVIKGGMDYLKKLDIRHAILELNGEQLLNNCPNRQEMFDLFVNNGLRPIKWFNETYSYPLDPKNLTGWTEHGSRMFDVEWVAIKK